MKYFQQKQFLIIFDDFDKTTIGKNVGLFAKSLAKNKIPVVIVTNSTSRNRHIKLPAGINLVRLGVKKKEWPALDDSVFRQYLTRNIDKFFGLWVYRGRIYTSWVLELGYENNLVQLVKLDSGGGFSHISQFLVRVFKREFMQKAMFLVRPYLKFISKFKLFYWFYYFDSPLVFSSIILCETPALFEGMSRFFGKEKCFLYPNSIPVWDFVRLENNFKKSGLLKKNHIISVGRIVRGKGFEKLIEAFAMVPLEIRKNWSLKIIGPFYDKPYLKYLNRLIRIKHLSKDVILTGGLYGNSLYKEYFQSKIMVMAYPKPTGSKGYEGQPNVLVESMFFKNVQVAVDVGSVPFLLDEGNCGVLLESNESREIAENIQRLLTEPREMSGLGEKARLRVESKFNLDQNFKKLLSKIKTEEYKFYMEDQRRDTILGDDIKGVIFKYCDFLLSILPNDFNLKNAKILDIGCREFFTYDYFLKKFKIRISGIDIGWEGLEFAKSKGVVNLDAHKMVSYYGLRKFDILIALHVLEHMYDLDLCLRNCYEILKKGGWLYFAIPMPAHNTRRGHWMEIKNEDAMIKICQRNKFKILFHEVYTQGEFRNEPEMMGLIQKN